MKRMFDENEIIQIASKSGGGKLYLHYISGTTSDHKHFDFYLYTSSSEPINSNDKAFNVLKVERFQIRKILGYITAQKNYCCGVVFDKVDTPAVRVEYLSEAGNNVVEDANIINDIVIEM